MKVCFPVLKNDGLESKIYDHFGSAPAFIIVDTDSNKIAVINNKDQHHAHGACNPLKALNNQKVDAVVVAGIGIGALTKLNQLDIKVYHTQGLTVRENIELFVSHNLPEITIQQCCSRHGKISKCQYV